MDYRLTIDVRGLVKHTTLDSIPTRYAQDPRLTGVTRRTTTTFTLTLAPDQPRTARAELLRDMRATVGLAETDARVVEVEALVA
jgi:hypothetical protein